MMVKQWRRTVLLAFALAVGAGWQALARLDPENADPAIPAGPRPEQVEWELPDHLHSFTEQKLALQTAASLARQWKEAGQKAGSADPAGKRAALFNDMGAWMAQLPNAPETEPLLAQAEALRAASRDDPGLLHCQGLLLQASGRYPEAFDLFLQAAARYDHVGAPGTLKARNAVAIYAVIHQIGDNHDKDQCFRWKDRALEFLAQGVAKDDLRPEDLRPLAKHINDHWTKIYWTRDGDSRHIVSRRIEELGGGEPWLVQFLLGHDYFGRAWASRGGGFAGTVTPEGWKGFGENYALATTHLKAALDLRPDFPEPIDFLLDISGAGHNPGPETTYDWFRRAVAAQIDYWPAYHSLLWYSLPRWGGSPERLFDILRMTSESERYDTRLPQYTLALFKTVARDQAAYPRPWTQRGRATSLWRDLECWTLFFRRVYEGYLRHDGPIPYPREKLLMDYLNYAHQFDRPDEFLRILGEWSPAVPFDSDEFERLHGYPLRLAEAKARLQTSGALDAFSKALNLRDYAAAEQALNAVEPDESARSYLETLRRTLSIRSQLEPEPGWNEHGAMPSLHPWAEYRGECRPALDGAFLGRSQDQRNLIVLRDDAPGDWEISADVAIVSNATAAADNAALLIAKDKETFIALTLYPAQNEAALTFGQSENVRRATVALDPPPARNRLRLRIADGRFSAWVNGQPCFADETFSEFTWAGKIRLGFGGLYPTAGAAVLFENVRTRPVPAASASEETP